MSTAEQILLLCLAGGAAIIALRDRVSRQRRDAHPDLRRLRAAGDRVRQYQLQRADIAAGRTFTDTPVQLEDDLRYAVDHATKLLVLREGSRLTGPIGDGDDGPAAAAAGLGAIVIVCADGSHHGFARALQLEHAALVAGELGRLLGVPVERV